MAAQAIQPDWSVTDEKITDAVERIVKAARPERVVLFGSRARGDHRADSDLDLAVIVDTPEDEVLRRVPYQALRGVGMEVSLIVVSRKKYDLHRPWVNSVFHSIDREGIVLYDRNDPQSSRFTALH
jgi:uncharacterized protein